MKFSVLISIYFKENPLYLKEALDSVFSQTIQPSEIVLVEDGPLTEDLYAVINEYKGKHPIFNIVKNETNLGLGLALAKGVESCSNEYIVRMDTDDIIPPQRFEKEIYKLAEGYDVVSCWSLLFENNLDNVIAIKKRPENHEEIEKLAHKRSPMCHAGSAFRRSAILSVGNYENHPLTEDYDLWVRLLLKGYKFYNIQEVLYYVRTSMEMASRRGGWKYATTELNNTFRFYKMGFFNLKDLILNTIVRFPVRIVPISLRKRLLKVIWKSSTK